MRKKIRVLSQPYVLRTGVTSVILEARRRLEWTSYTLQGGLWWRKEPKQVPLRGNLVGKYAAYGQKHPGGLPLRTGEAFRRCA
jgi:hypothetical protein